MALVNCPECKKSISDTCETCPKCGYKITKEDIEGIKKGQENAQKGCLIGCFVFLLIPLLMIMCKPNTPDTANNTSQEVVRNSSWDGSVQQVKSWLKSNAKDPDSIEYLDWSPVKKNDKGFFVRVKYRGNNSFGGKVIEEKIFFMDHSGNIINQVNRN
jgi:hypothetical protein